MSLSSNGFVTSANDFVNGNWSYGYDSLDRMTSASKTGTAMNWKYDLQGNRWQQNYTAGSGPMPQYSFTNNRIDTASYDGAGNMEQDFALPTANTYTYDAEGRVYQVSGGTSATYTYDGMGRRVKGPSYEFVYDLAGHAASLLNKSTDAVVATEIFAGARHVASYFNNQTYFAHSDHLGTERARTDYAGNMCQTMTNLPFGDAQAYPTNSCSDADGRTMGGLEYDSETGLEHTLFRKFYSTPGRWMTPDPAGTAVADLTNPQTWNRYSYVTNNTSTVNDPLGLEGLSIHRCGWTGGSGDCESVVMFNNNAGVYGIAASGNLVITTAYKWYAPTIFGGVSSFIYSDGDYIDGSIAAESMQLTGGGLSVAGYNLTLSSLTLSTTQTSVGQDGGGRSAANNATNNGTTIGPANPKDKPNVPPTWDYCKSYRDGTGAGSALYNLCMSFPNNPWSNCVRGKLLNQYVPNGNPLDLSIYLVWDHPKDFATCALP